MEESVRRITLLVRQLDAFLKAYPNLVQEVTYKMLRSLLDQYSSPTPDTNSPSSTPSSAQASVLEESNGTSLETEVTSMLVKLETLTLRWRESSGRKLVGQEITYEIRDLLSNLFTVTTAIASCVKSLATAQTT